jgi:hypothetical protein
VWATDWAFIWDGAGKILGLYLGRCGQQFGFLFVKVRATDWTFIWDGAGKNLGLYLARCGLQTGPIFFEM